MKPLSIIILISSVFLSRSEAQSFTVDSIAYNILSTTLPYTAEVTSKFPGSYWGNIEIPEQVTYQSKVYTVIGISTSAFENSPGLTKVVIPNTVTFMGEWVFHDCPGLQFISIPASLVAMGMNCFQYCVSLKGIYVDPDNPNFASVDSILYNKDITTLLTCPAARTTIEIPSSVAIIDGLAFMNSRITSLEIPNSVTIIGPMAFLQCKELSSVTIPNSVTSIQNGAFEECSKLASVVLPNSIDSIDFSTFKGCSSLTSVEIPISVTRILNMAFEGCSSLTSFTIPNSVTMIEKWVFRGCTALEVIDIHEEITSIGYMAFEGCTSLTKIEIPNSVTSIDHGAFENCISLDSVVLPNSITSISSSLFYGCTGLTYIEIPNSIEEIGWDAFWGCSALQTILIPGSVETINGMAFRDCTGLTSITCQAVIPPHLVHSDVFDGVPRSIPLYVPAESVNDYTAASVWNEFLIMTGTNSLIHNELTVWPNPVSDRLIIEGAGAGVLISVYDINGKMVISCIVKSESELIDFTGIPSGMYLVKVEFNGNAKNYKIIRN